MDLRATRRRLPLEGPCVLQQTFSGITHGSHFIEIDLRLTEKEEAERTDKEGREGESFFSVKVFVLFSL